MRASFTSFAPMRRRCAQSDFGVMYQDGTTEKELRPQLRRPQECLGRRVVCPRLALLRAARRPARFELGAFWKKA